MTQKSHISDKLSHKLYLAPFPRYNIVKSETTLPQFKPPIKGTPFKFCNQTWHRIVKTLGYILVASAVLSQYTRVTDRRQTTTDRRHLMAIAELEMQLHRSAKMKCLVFWDTVWDNPLILKLKTYELNWRTEISPSCDTLLLKWMYM